MPIDLPGTRNHSIRRIADCLCPRQPIHDVRLDDDGFVTWSARTNTGHVFDKPRRDVAEHDMVERINGAGTAPSFPQGGGSRPNLVTPARIRSLRGECKSRVGAS